MLPGASPVESTLAEDWSAVKDAVKRFENAWRQGLRPAVDGYLPLGEPLRSRVLIELVHIDLELRLKAGETARVEEYLARYPELARDKALALELIAAEYELRRRKEADLSLDEYRQRFPQYRELLREQIEQPTVVGRGTPRLQAAALDEVLPEVDGYEVLSPLGRGGMGSVYEARQLSLDRRVALKFLPAECTRDPVWLVRFRREACTASALNHPNICTIYDTGESADRPFLSMELIEGRTLATLVGQRPPVREVTRLIGQVAQALAAAHAAGVVHRDIKPENLMVRDDGLVKVLDFGLARRLPTGGAEGSAADGKGTVPGAWLGTLLYMSPEQARAESVNTASDIFSLGLVLYELVTGQHPFRADTEIGILHAIVAQGPVAPSRLNPEIPARLEALIQHMLAKDAGQRPTAMAVEEALSQWEVEIDAGPGIRPARPARQPTVGRQQELAALRAGFEQAAAGHGLLLCVTGEPGIGKTTLVESFLEELAASNSAWSSARGCCSERLAGAEAYLPFLDALESLLQGDSGASAAQQMKLLAPTWYVQLVPLAADESSPDGVLAQAKDASQERRKREIGVFLQEFTRHRPLVLFLDDFHWADPSSVDLLAYLGSKWARWRLLLLVTCRPSDLLRSRHPFGPVKLELQGRGVCREIALPFLSREDVARYLALTFDGHQFPEELADVLHARTEGSPLFMVDLLRYLRDCRVIDQEQGRWSLAQPVTNLRHDLPESVRSMIQRKTDQLSEADRRLLMAASVQGREFDSAVVAQVLGHEAAEVEERLEVLERVHVLVRRLREHAFPDNTLTQRYGFVHVLYQNAMYAALQPTRKAVWSAAAARVLLGYYGSGDAAVAGELAILFEAAQEFERAADYFLRAAENAVRVCAHREAVVLARRGLELLQSLSPTLECAERELGLSMTLGLQLQVTAGFASAEAKQVYLRARELCDQIGQSPFLYPVLWGLFICCKARSELSKARELAGELHVLAKKQDDPALTLQSHQAYAVTTLCQGEPSATRYHMECAETLYDPHRHQSHTYLFGQDVGVASKAFGAVALWLLGYPDQAAQKSHEAVALGHRLSQPSSQTLALHFAALLHQCRREPHAVLACADQTLAIAAEQSFAFWHAGGTVMRGWALSACGSRREGIAVLRRGLAAWLATESLTYQTYYLALLAEALEKDGQKREALKVLDDALSLAERTGERFFQAELHRLQGELLASTAESAGLRQAEACFHNAIAVARRQAARSLELRAAMSLTRLYQRQDRQAEGRPMLAECYNWFTEGFGTHDLREAKALLE